MYILKIGEIIGVIKNRSKVLFLILILVLLFGISLGSLSAISFGLMNDYQKTQVANSIGSIAPILAKPTELFKNKEFFKLNFYIFFNNTRAAFVHTILGILIIPTFFLLYSQGTLIGLVFGISGKFLISIYSIVELIMIFFVFLVELVSFTLASIEGIYLGISIFSPTRIFKKKIPRKIAFMKTIRQTANVYVIILTLLFIGAVIETLVMFNLSRRDIKHIDIFQECGVVFDSVFKNSPAEKIQLTSDSAIIKINDQKFSNLTEFTEIMDRYSPDDTIKLTNRKGEEYFLTLDKSPESLNINRGFIGINGVKTALVKKDEC